MAKYPYFRVTALQAKDLNRLITDMTRTAHESITKNRQLRADVNRIYAYYMNSDGGPVPARTDKDNPEEYKALRTHYFVTGDGRIVWEMPYAENTYNGLLSDKKGNALRPIKHWTTENTGPEWDVKFATDRRYDDLRNKFVDDAAKLIIPVFVKGVKYGR